MSWGIIYVVHNSRMGPQTVKVGKTSRLIGERIRELNAATSNLGRFEALAYFPVEDIDQAESECHAALAQYRIQTNREFFEGDVQQIVKIVEKVTRQFKPELRIFIPVGDEDVIPTRQVEGLTSRLAGMTKEAEIRKTNEIGQERQKLVQFQEALSELKDELRGHISDVAQRRDVSIRVPEIEPTSFDDQSFRHLIKNREIEQLDGGAESALAILRSRQAIVPVAEVRLYDSSDDRPAILLPSSNYLQDDRKLGGTPIQTRDDGRILDIAIYARTLTSQDLESMSDWSQYTDHDVDPAERPVCFHISIFDFHYTGEDTLAPYYRMRGLSTSDALFDPSFVADTFLQVIADNLYPNCLHARDTQIDLADGTQIVESFFNPVLNSLPSDWAERSWVVDLHFHGCRTCWHKWQSFESKSSCPNCNR